MFGDLALVGRCQLHKARNVEGHLPKSEQYLVRRRLVEAFHHPDPDQGLADARRLTTDLDTYPDAADPRGTDRDVHRPPARRDRLPGAVVAAGGPDPFA